MASAPLVLPSILLALVLIVSGLAKLRAPRAAADAFVSLRLPPALSRLGAPRALPYAELLLALLLLITTGRAYAVIALLALALFVAYAVIIARALGFPEPVECACFGELGLGSVSRWTLVRNVVLVVTAGLAVVDAVSQRRSVVARVAGFGSVEWTWLALAVLAGLLGVLVAHGGGESRATLPSDQDELEDYVRQPIPYGALEHADGTTVPLRRLAERRAQLLVFLSGSCGSCLRVAPLLPGFAERNPEVGVAMVLHRGMPTTGLPDDGTERLLDPDGVVAATFAVPKPAAVLLGADGLLAGGPVVGDTAVSAFLDDIEAELTAARGVSRTKAD